MEKEKLNLFQRIIKVMEEVKSVHKGVDVSTGYNGPSYAAVSHDDVTALLHGPCTRHGIVIISSIESKSLESFTNNKGNTQYKVELNVEMTFINADNPEDRMSVASYAYAFDSSDKAVGKAFSMAVKYPLLKTFMLESLDNEESRDYEKSSYSSQVSGPNKQYDNGPKPSNAGPITSANTGSVASEKQISAIKAIAKSKGVQAKEVKTSKEASEEIKRLNSL